MLLVKPNGIMSSLHGSYMRGVGWLGCRSKGVMLPSWSFNVEMMMKRGYCENEY